MLDRNAEKICFKNLRNNMTDISGEDEKERASDEKNVETEGDTMIRFNEFIWMPCNLILFPYFIIFI